MRGVDYVFQAAALKQVPACEFYPMQAVQTNVLGSANVLEAAIRNGVQKTVVLSTDKAVYPINTMGMTKALMEKLAIASSRDPRVIENSSSIAVTRYGNVMCSRGSIIPLFIKQILDGEALTVTNPNMTRFMMTLTNSVELVMFAFENAMPGDLFVQKSPAATVAELAEALKEIFNSSVPIKIIGSRHGEKMHETLCGSEEMAKAEDLGGFYRVPADLRDINYNNRDNVSDTGDLSNESYDSANTRRLSRQELIDLLLSLDYVQQMLAR
jgi:UDP-glucose 4-epimerase